MDFQYSNLQQRLLHLQLEFLNNYHNQLFPQQHALIKNESRLKGVAIIPIRGTALDSRSLPFAKVGNKTTYPSFYNSVISKRIKDELDINEFEPYVEIKEIVQGSSFIAKKAKTYDEEKNVAAKAPVDDIQIKDLSSTKKETANISKEKFSYIIKIADFYFEKSAKNMKSRIIAETIIKKISISKLSSTKFRVFIGPFKDLNSLKKSFNAINVLQFDSIEIIKK